MTKHKILFVDEIGRIDGAEIVLYNLVTHLDRNHFEPCVVCGSEGQLVDRLRSREIPVHVLPLKEPGSLFTRPIGGMRFFNPLNAVINAIRGLAYGARLYRFIIAHPVDLVHTNTLLANLFGTLPAALSRKALVWHEHNIQPIGLRRFVVNVMGRLFPDKVICISKAVRSTYTLLPDAQKLITIYNGIDLETFHPSAQTFGLHEEFGIPSDCQIVAITAPLRPWKGQKYFLYAAQQILKDYKNVHFLLVGDEVFSKDKGYKHFLVTLASSLSIANNVHFAGFRADIPKILPMIDILVSTSILPEPFSLIIAEAMASGKPVVATRTGGVPEVVDDGVTGILVEPEDHAELSKALLRLLQDQATAKAMGSAGRKRAEQLFSLRRFVRDVEGVYFDVLRDRRS